MKLDKIVTFFSLFTLASCSTLVDYKETYYGSYKFIRPNSIVADGYFRNGFLLTNVDNTNVKYYKDVLNYNNTAQKDAIEGRFGSQYNWTLCQWWAPEEDDFVNYLLSVIPPDMFNFYFLSVLGAVVLTE
jgi:hypothetical protein